MARHTSPHYFCFGSSQTDIRQIGYTIVNDMGRSGSQGNPHALYAVATPLSRTPAALRHGE